MATEARPHEQELHKGQKLLKRMAVVYKLSDAASIALGVRLQSPNPARRYPLQRTVRRLIR